MVSNPIELLAKSRVKGFIERFATDSRELFINDEGKLHHPGEFGTYRERVLRELISDFVPQYMFLGEGFVCNKRNERSTQCDLVICDGNETPKIESDDSRRFYPVETLYGVGEVKSKLSIGELTTAARKLLEIKRLRWNKPSITVPIKNFDVDLSDTNRYSSDDSGASPADLADINVWDPKNKEFQNIVTFIVCESIGLGQKSMIDVAKGLYRPSIGDAPLRHNFILSLEDGLLSYKTETSHEVLTPYGFPHKGSAATAYRFVEPNEDGGHVLAFLSGLVSALSQTCIYKFDINDYVKPPVEHSSPMS